MTMASSSSSFVIASPAFVQYDTSLHKTAMLLSFIFLTTTQAKKQETFVRSKIFVVLKYDAL
jgi:hypothetical protein